jgi:hypothetical protein
MTTLRPIRSPFIEGGTPPEDRSVNVTIENKPLGLDPRKFFHDTKAYAMNNMLMLAVVLLVIIVIVYLVYKKMHSPSTVSPPRPSGVTPQIPPPLAPAPFSVRSPMSNLDSQIVIDTPDNMARRAEIAAGAPGTVEPISSLEGDAHNSNESSIIGDLTDVPTNA